MNIEEFTQLEQKYCRDMDIHEVCLTCQFRCKRPYTFWSGCMPPDEYCEDYEPHPYWIVIMKMANELEGN